MRRRKQENAGISAHCEVESFSVAAFRDEARRQTWTCAALCGLILAATFAVAAGTV